jgi:hypothetical protein
LHDIHDLSGRYPTDAASGFAVAAVPGAQLAPRRRGRQCCWYHEGDWRAASTVAIRAPTQTGPEQLAHIDANTDERVFAALAIVRAETLHADAGVVDQHVDRAQPSVTRRNLVDLGRIGHVQAHAQRGNAGRRSCRAARSAGSKVRTVTATAAPASPSAWVSARPMPRLAPMTKATRPASEKESRTVTGQGTSTMRSMTI